MKILFISKSLRSGGKERRMVELIRGLLNKDPSITVELIITVKEIHYTEILDLGVKIHLFERKRLKKDPRLFFKFYKVIRKFKPDIIHVWDGMVAVYSIPSKIILNIPLLNSQITDAPFKVKKSFLHHRLTFFFSNIITANSYAGLKVYDAPVFKSKVIYNGFDFNRIANLKSKIDIKKQFSIETPFVVGMVASFSELKDYATFIKAANLILEKRADVTFLSIGSGDDSKYREMVSSQNKNRILFLGSQKNVENIMNVCDIGVLASFTEGISNTLMEFMALGKVVVATGEGGTKELIKNNVNGIHIPAKNPSLLKEKIEVLLDNPDLRSKLGQYGKRTIEEKFNIAKMLNSFLEEYKKLCAE